MLGCEHIVISRGRAARAAAPKAGTQDAGPPGVPRLRAGARSGGRLSRSVERMVRIDRKAVDSDVVKVTALLDLLLGAVMAGRAQGQQFAGDEGVPVSTMRDDVIDHARGGDDPAGQAELAQGMSVTGMRFHVCRDQRAHA